MGQESGRWLRIKRAAVPTAWNLFMRAGALIDRSLPNVHPCGDLVTGADGKEPINGWANSPRIEELRAAWLS